jgi:formamidopyrimidine-DNA glycosylase
MPELPEVETIARRLREVVIGKKIHSISIFREKSFQGVPETLVGATIQDITRRSKILQFHFDRPEKLLVHLKMTGQLIYVDAHTRLGGGHPTQDWLQELPTKHTRVELGLSDSAKLFFNDLRVFGWLRVLTPEEVEKELSALGPDIIDAAVTPKYLEEMFKKRSVPIKQLVMDNAIAAGVGNIYANDALNMARISPFRPANTLSKEEIEKLYTALTTVISRGIELGGATIHSFRHVDGFAGDYQDEVLTYGREGESCKNCSGIIIRKKQGGRSTFYCPNCQV